MTPQLASGDLISDRYALALYDLATEKKVVDSVLENLQKLKKVIDNNKELSLLIKSPLINSNDKLEVLIKLTLPSNFNELSTTFLKVIANNKRFANLTLMISQFVNIDSIKRGNISADITSADQLTEGQRINVNNQLRKILGDKLSLNFKVNKKIIGGLIIKVGSKMIDTSLANKINKLKIAMKGA